MRPVAAVSYRFRVALLLIVAAAAIDAATVRRDKRQVPLAAACDMYATCAPPAVCLSGQCQCAQPYAAVASSCVLAYPRPMSPLMTSGLYLQPQQAHLAYPSAYLQAAPAQYAIPAYQTVQSHYPLLAQPAPVHLGPLQPQSVHLPAPVHPMPPQPQPIQPPTPGHPVSQQAEHGSVQQPGPGELATPPPQVAPQTTTATTPRLYDEPSISYPGGYCNLPRTVCVGGSICVNNVCTCRRGEEIVSNQCEKVEVTLATESPTSSTSSPSPSSTIGTTAATTATTATAAVITETTTAPTTTSATTIAPTTTTAVTSVVTVAPTTPVVLAAETTNTSAHTTTTTYTGRQQEFNPMYAPQRPCVNCCPQGAKNCLPQVLRINLSYPSAPPTNRGCQSNVDCQRGTSCRQGSCH